MGLYTPEALQDLIDIFDYILKQSGSVDTGARYINEIENRCVMIHRQPYAGRKRSDVRPDIRSFPVHFTHHMLSRRR